uniref:Uncharacterized protein n=1 Tax=Rhizophora mucronata TaxID=61149 RepID=A0A2P2PUB0_RHIMU
MMICFRTTFPVIFFKELLMFLVE